MRKVSLIIILSILFLTGCESLRQTSLDLAIEEQKNVAAMREISIISIKNWPMISGLIKGVMQPRMDELPEHIVSAMEELDKISEKYNVENPEYNDNDLGFAVGLRIRILCATIQEALKFYAPDVIELIPLKF